MWNISNRRKNTYLHSRVQIMNPALLNMCVDTARVDLDTILPRRKPFNPQLLPLEPASLCSEPDPSKTYLSYGLLGLPGVLKKIVSKNSRLQYKALNTLADLLVNPLELHRAVYEFDVVRRLEAVLLWNMAEVPHNIRVISKILTNLAHLAEHFEAAWRMVVQYELIDALYCLVKASQCLKDEAANVLLLMSSHPSVVDVMLIQGHLGRVLTLLKKVDNVENVYIYLSNLLERAPAAGVDLRIFDFLIPKLCKRDNLLPIVMKCIAFLLNTPHAHELFDQIDGVTVIYDLLKDDTVEGILLENTVMALKNCTINKIALWRCREFWDLPVILVKHAHNRENDVLQLYCLQTLRQVTVMPSVKDFVRKVCKKHIKMIECRKDFVCAAKKILLQWLRKKSYINVEAEDVCGEEQEKHAEFSEESSEIESDTEDAKSVDEGSTVAKMPKPIAYRLDYGHICPEKVSSDTSIRPKPPHSCHDPKKSDSLARFMTITSVLRKLRGNTVFDKKNLEKDPEEKIFGFYGKSGVMGSTYSNYGKYRRERKERTATMLSAPSFIPLLKKYQRAIFVQGPPQGATYVGSTYVGTASRPFLPNVRTNPTLRNPNPVIRPSLPDAEFRRRAIVASASKVSNSSRGMSMRSF